MGGWMDACMLWVHNIQQSKRILTDVQLAYISNAANNVPGERQCDQMLKKS